MMCFIQEGDIGWCTERDGGRTTFGQYKDPIIEIDKISPFLAVTLIFNTIKAKGVFV